VDALKRCGICSPRQQKQCRLTQEQPTINRIEILIQEKRIENRSFQNRRRFNELVLLFYLSDERKAGTDFVHETDGGCTERI
jgi:hypothetical protein